MQSPERLFDDVRPCVCSHEARRHAHYRRGTDCGACGPISCPALRLDLTPLQRLRKLVFG